MTPQLRPSPRRASAEASARLDMSKQNTPASGAGGGKKRKWTEADNQTLLAHQAREQAAGNEHPWKGQAGPKGILPHLTDLVDADLYRQAKQLNQGARRRAKTAAARASAPPPPRAQKGMTSKYRGVHCPAAVRGLRPSSTREPFLDASRNRAGTSVGKWRATVTINGDTQELGTFNHEDDAGRAAQTAREDARREAAAALRRHVSGNR